MIGINIFPQRCNRELPREARTGIAYHDQDSSLAVAAHQALHYLARIFFGAITALAKNWTASFTFQRPAGDQLILDGRMDNHQVHMELQLTDRNKFLLVSRGFHRIQEAPLGPLLMVGQYDRRGSSSAS